MDSKLINVILLGLSFFLVFFAFQTSVFIQQTVVNSIRSQPKSDFRGDGYISLCVTYLVFAISNWLSPSVVGFLRPKWSMFLSAICYALYSASFLQPTTVSFYAAAVLTGLAAGPLWAAQGAYLAAQSDEKTASRNSGLFWAMLQGSILFGNLFVYLALDNKTTISDETRYLIYGTLTGVCLLGLLVMLCLSNKRRISLDEQGHEIAPISAWAQLTGAMRLSVTSNMLLITIASFYTGQLLTFFSGVYGTALGATSQFGPDSKKYIGLSGIFLGFGEILGGLVFGLIGTTLIGGNEADRKPLRRDKVFGIGLVLACAALASIYVNLPPDSPLGQQAQIAPILERPLIWLAMLASLLLGLADAAFNTQLYSLTMALYKSESALPAFALSKFAHCIGSAVTFFYSRHLDLYCQIYLLLVGSVLATIAFSLADAAHRHLAGSRKSITSHL